MFLQLLHICGFVGLNGALPIQNNIKIHLRNHPIQHLNHMSSNCDPMVYPLLFSKGDLEWVQDALHTAEHCTAKRQTITHL